MGGNLAFPGRAQLAGYAGLAGALRGRARPAAVIVAVDVLAVALAFGALHIAGTIMAGKAPAPQHVGAISLAHPVSAVPGPVAPIVDAVRIGLAAAPALMLASADADALFAAPDFVSSGFSESAAATATTQGGLAIAPAPEEQSSPSVVSPPVEKIASIAVRGREIAEAAVAGAANAVDGSLDRLLLRGDAGSTVAVAQTASLGLDINGAPPLVTANAPASASPGNSVGAVVGGVADTVAAAVAQPVASVVGLLN